MKKITSLFTLLLFVILVSAQSEKRPLNTDDILKWNRITETLISNDGKIIVYKQEPWKGDPVLEITTPKGEEKTSIKCATNAQITFDSKLVVYTLKPAEDSIRILKLKKTKKEDFPLDKLGIYNLADNSKQIVSGLISVKVPEKWAGWIAWQTEAPKDTTQKGKNDKEKGKNSSAKSDENVYPLFIRNLNTGETTEIPNVSDYIFAEGKEVLVFISEGKDSTFDAGIYRYNLSGNSNLKIQNGKGKFKQLSVNKTGEKVAFLSGVSAEKKEEINYGLYLWNEKDTATEVVNNGSIAFPENWEISENGQLSFSENGSRLFFGTAPKKAPKDTTVLEEEIPVLDIWTWNEEELQTVQLYNQKRDSKKSYLAVYYPDDKKRLSRNTAGFARRLIFVLVQCR